MENWSL